MSLVVEILSGGLLLAGAAFCVIGGIGVSGVRSDQDAVVGKAGLAALKPK